MTDMVIPPEAVEAALDVVMDDGHNGLDCRPERSLEVTVQAALEAALPHLRLMPVTSREPEGDALKAIEKWYADMHGEDSLMFNFSSGRMSAPDDESDLRSLVETATRLGRELGRREAAEEAAKLADDLAAGVENPEKPYNEAFIHACGVVARHIREIATEEPK